MTVRLPAALLALLLAGCASSGAPEPAQEAVRPNVLVIVADDLGWHDLGAYGNRFHETPRLDRLAAEGVRFTDGYAAAPLCSPTRASLLTGRTPAALGITEHFRGRPTPEPWQRVIPPEQPQQLPAETTTLAELLRDAGYATAHIGKWHLGWAGSAPTDHGFGLNIGGSGRGLPPSFFYPYVGADAEADLVGEPGDAAREGEYLTDRLTDEAIAYLEAHQDTAFFLHLAYYTVHVPIEGPPGLVAKYEARAAAGDYGFENPEYAAMVESLDQNVGRVLDALDRLGLAEETLVLFVSDNGGLSVEEVPAFAAHTPVTDNGALRAGKGYLWEGGVRVPFLARWTGRVPAGQTSAAPVSTIDVLPTVAPLAGAEVPAAVEGVDLWPALSGGGALGREALHFHQPHYSPQGGRPASTIRVGDLKLYEDLETGARELYDLAADPDESNDLAAERPDVTDDLHARLEAWRERVGAPMPTPNPAFDPEAPVPPRWSTPDS